MRKKKVFSIILMCALFTMCFSFETKAASNEIHIVKLGAEENYLPREGVKKFKVDYRDEENNTRNIPVIGYEYEFTMSDSLSYGAWRNGVSGGSDETVLKLIFNRDD